MKNTIRALFLVQNIIFSSVEIQLKFIRLSSYAYFFRLFWVSNIFVVVFRVWLSKILKAANGGVRILGTGVYNFMIHETTLSSENLFEMTYCNNIIKDVK